MATETSRGDPAHSARSPSLIRGTEQSWLRGPDTYLTESARLVRSRLGSSNGRFMCGWPPACKSFVACGAVACGHVSGPFDAVSHGPLALMGSADRGLIKSSGSGSREPTQAALDPSGRSTLPSRFVALQASGHVVAAERQLMLPLRHAVVSCLGAICPNSPRRLTTTCPRPAPQQTEPI
jgi:hypothetical protein